MATRFRNFVTVVYEESAPPDWKSILSEQLVPAFISPYHDCDVNPTGEVKKPHYHVMIMFEGQKSPEQAKEIFDKIGGVGCLVVNSIRSMARYLCHLDNPDKAQYKVEDVTSLSGADYHGICSLAIDKYKAIGEMIDFCEENNIVSFSQLLVYCRAERFDWFRVLCDNGTVVMREFLKSKDWTQRQI